MASALTFPHGSLRAYEECCDWPLHALRFMQDKGFVDGFPALGHGGYCSMLLSNRM
jgi:hypothetical protein